MKIKQTILTLGLAASIVTGTIAYANTASAALKCGEVDTSIIGGATCGNVKKDSQNVKETGVWALLILALNILTAGVGIAAVGGIAYGSALYASSADKPDQAKAGVTFIKNVVIGLIAYGLMFVVLNFLIPGGLFT
jgi:hypothetical protein